jgi:acyl-CoA synthetase (AMP-forming)/AMP-acid ligase II
MGESKGVAEEGARSQPSPLFPSSLLELLEQEPSRVVFEAGERKLSRGELLALIERLASALRAVGLGPGRGIAIFTGVSPEAFAAHIAAHTLGCRVVGVRPGYAARQLEHVLRMQIDALLVDRQTSSPELLRAAGAARQLSLGPCQGALDLLAAPRSGRSLQIDARPDDVAALYFTSGSTGRPKGCAMTYRALSVHWAWKHPRGWAGVAPEFGASFERYMLYGTLASLVVFEFLAPCLLGGGTAVIPEPELAPLFPDALSHHRISGAIVTVPRFTQMLDRLKREHFDLTSVRALMVSGSPIAPHRLASGIERLGPVVYQGYGQTEAGSISMATPRDFASDPTRALVSVGRPHPGVEISVRDADGRPLPDGRTGELYLKSPHQMSAYWDQPEETRDTLRDGWLCTRDLGRVDERGFVHLVGRTREVAMVNAMVVYLGPIERVLASHPDVDQAYVAATPDERSGESVHAFVVPAPGRRLDQAALCSLVRAELGSDSVPATITPLSSVPVAASGKPDKRALLNSLTGRVGE